MKVSPIIFSTPMVQAILDGSKKQTRISIIDIDPQSKKYPGSFFNNTATFDFIEPSEFDKPNNKKLVSLVVCPYGFKGDLLWVRETWAMHHGQIIYKASYTGSDKIRWKPSIHLKKEDSRIWLRVINVKVERLNRISKHDAIQQGVKVMFKMDMGASTINTTALIWVAQTILSNPFNPYGLIYTVKDPMKRIPGSLS